MSERRSNDRRKSGGGDKNRKSSVGRKYSDNKFGKKPFKKSDDGEKSGLPFKRKPLGRKSSEPNPEKGKFARKGFNRAEGDERPARRRDDDRERKPYGDRTGERREYKRRDDGNERPARRREDNTERPRRTRDNDGERKPYGRREEGEGRERRSYNRDERPTRRREDGDERPARRTRDNDSERKPYGERGGEKREYKRREDGDERPARRTRDEDVERKPYGRRDESEARENRREDNDERPQSPERPLKDGDERPARRSRDDDGERKPYGRREESEGRERRSFDREERPARKTEDGDERPARRSRDNDGERKPYGRREDSTERPQRPSRPTRDTDGERKPSGERKRWDEREITFGKKGKDGGKKRRRNDGDDEGYSEKAMPFADNETLRLNKFIANAGICSRRQADEYIADGAVTVNGEVVREMGHRVKKSDDVRFKGKKVEYGRKVYILLNKPKDFLTTVTDDRERKTVMELIKGATDEKVFPVGRLDRSTTGLLLFTNDGELTQQLTHPSFGVTKVYHVSLDKPVAIEDMEKIAAGVELEDGLAEVDEIAYADIKDKSQVGIELHIGMNRIVRRIFESLGYDVRKLDRVLYAGISKKDLPRGKWRLLTEKEVMQLKKFNEKR